MEILAKITEVIIQPAILLVFSLGFLLFVWGLVVFAANPTDTTKRQQGTKHMLWGIVGMFIMVSVQGIIFLIDDTFDLDVRGTQSSFQQPRGGSGGAGFGLPR